MLCSKCGAENPDGVNFCARCGSILKKDTPASSFTTGTKKPGTFEQLDLISQEIEKLGTFHKLGYYIEGFIILTIFSIYTLFIGPIIVYLWRKRGWPRNMLVKAVLYYEAYVIGIIAVIVIIAMGLFIFIAVIAAFLFGTGLR